LLREAVAIRKKLTPVVHPETAQALNELASILERQNKLEAAETIQREAVEMQRQLGLARPDAATCLGNLAHVLRARGKRTEAESLVRESLDLWRKLDGSDQRHVTASLHTLGLMLMDRRDFAGAETNLREELVLLEKGPAKDPPRREANFLWLA